MTYAFGWRGAFLVPAGVCLVTAILYLRLVPDDRHKAGSRTSAPDVAFAPWLAATIFGLFAVVALTAGLVFHIATVALPKIVDAPPPAFPAEPKSFPAPPTLKPAAAPVPAPAAQIGRAHV